MAAEESGDATADAVRPHRLIQCLLLGSVDERAFAVGRRDAADALLDRSNLRRRAAREPQPHQRWNARTFTEKLLQLAIRLLEILD